MTVLRRIGRAIAIFALFWAIGLHWIALQSLAWTTMIIDYSKRAPICRAIAQTFDGAHPCTLCHVVNAAKNSEKKPNVQLSAPKIDMIYPSPTARSIRPFISFEYAVSDFYCSGIGRSPPVPPPRSFLS